MSLKNILLEKLQQRQEMTRDDLRNFARNLKTQRNLFGFDVATCDRKLRELTEEGEIKPIMRNGYNVAYRAVKSAKKSDLSDKISLNNRLRAILAQIPLNWQNQAEIKKLDNLIKSDNIYNKQKFLENENL